MTRTHPRSVAVFVLVATTVMLLAAVSRAIEPAHAASRIVRASLNFATPPAGYTISTLAVGGSYPSYLDARVVSAGGGRVVSVVSGTGYNNAADFPAYVPLGSKPPSAIVRIANRSSAVDPLSTGYTNFTWQADFSLDDTVSADRADGDNLLQRGLWPQRQWKLSVDGRVARCFVRTTANGPVASTPGITIPRQTSNVRWYRAICNRSQAGVLTLRVYAYSASARGWAYFGGSTAPTSASGSLTMAWSIPVSVGGKLTDSGAVSSSPDQFNGRVDNVILAIGP